MSRGIEVYSKSEFSTWLYEKMVPYFEDNTDVQDIDFVIFNYIHGDIMTVETKERNGRIKTQAQKDTQNVLRQILMLGAANSTIHTLRGVRPLKYHGHHLVQFQHTTPDNGLIKLDGKLIPREEFIKFLNFGRDLKEPQS